MEPASLTTQITAGAWRGTVRKRAAPDGMPGPLAWPSSAGCSSS